MGCRELVRVGKLGLRADDSRSGEEEARAALWRGREAVFCGLSGDILLYFPSSLLLPLPRRSGVLMEGRMHVTFTDRRLLVRGGCVPVLASLQYPSAQSTTIPFAMRCLICFQLAYAIRSSGPGTGPIMLWRSVETSGEERRGGRTPSSRKREVRFVS
ncbi:hypothetical protein MRB53_037797 [Persea americana]|nr:hypothetical protein MRB53_037797 [Persea americana]